MQPEPKLPHSEPKLSSPVPSPARGTAARRSRLALSSLALALLVLSSASLAPPVLAGPPATATAQLWTCGMHPQVIQDKPGTCPICGMALTPLKSEVEAAAAGDERAGSDIVIDPVVEQNMGVRTARVEEGPLHARVRAVGYLVEPESSWLDINLRVSGWIEKLHANVEGMHVPKGGALFDLYSPELQVAIEELLAAQRLPSAAPGAEMLQQSAARKLQLLGLSQEQIDSFAGRKQAPLAITFRSPFDAHVIAKMVNAGSAVKAGDTVLRLSDRSTMWLDLQVYEQDLPFVGNGATVEATFPALPGERIDGVVSFVHPHVDPQARTVLMRVSLPNPDGRLRQGMYASAEIRGLVARQALRVPREAVIDTGTRQVAFVRRGPGRFEPRNVVLGSLAEDGMAQIASGLHAGEEVVTSGQFLLDAESRLREAVLKFLSGRGAASPAQPDSGAAAQGGADHGRHIH